jgi:hypothetical protein
MRSSFLRNVTQRTLMFTDVSGQPIGLTFKNQVFWPWKMGPIGCPETSVTIYQSILRNIPEERSPSPDIFNITVFSLFKYILYGKIFGMKFTFLFILQIILGKQLLGRCIQLNLCDMESKPISWTGQTEAKIKFTTQLKNPRVPSHY